MHHPPLSTLPTLSIPALATRLRRTGRDVLSRAEGRRDERNRRSNVNKVPLGGRGVDLEDFRIIGIVLGREEEWKKRKLVSLIVFFF